MMRRFPPLWPLVGVLVGCLVLSAPVLAEEGEEELDPVSAEVKAQMEKIIELMRENEAALLEISTGNKAKPKRVDVDVDPPEGPPQGGASSGSEGSSSGSSSSGSEGASSGSSSSGSSGGADGGSRSRQEAIRKLDEMVSGQRQVGEQIPKELEELVRMAPQ